MKYIYITTLSLFALVSCGTDNSSDKQTVDQIIESKDINAIETRKTELVNQSSNIYAKISMLQEAANELEDGESLVLVKGQKVKSGVFKHFVEVQGDVKTKQNILIYPEFSGVLKKVYVKEGQSVKKGQLLAKIDDGGLYRQLKQLEIQLDLSKTTFERRSKLWDKKIGSEIQYLQAKANYETTVESLNQLKENVAKSSVYATFSGVIDYVMIHEGQVVAPGQSLFRLINLRNMYVEAQVPESYMATITKGIEATIEFPFINTTANTKVKQVGNHIGKANRSFIIMMDVENKDRTIKPNMVVNVKLNDYTNLETIEIPVSVLLENAKGEKYLYIAEITTNPKVMVAKKVFLKLGKEQGSKVEVLEGLKTNDIIIVEGGKEIEDKQRIAVEI